MDYQDFMNLANLILYPIEFFLMLVYAVWDILANDLGIPYFADFSFNIYLFSETGWFTEPMPFFVFIILISAIFMFIFLIRLIWKGTKKFINMIFGVFRL